MIREQCPYFKLDDWGVCQYQYDWFKDVCDENCIMNYDKENYNTEKTNKT